MRTFRISVSRENFNKSKGAKLGLTNRPQRFEGTLDQILEHVSEGFPLLPCVLKDYNAHRSDKNWQEQKLYVSEVDCGYSIEDAKHDSFLRSNAMALFTTFTHNKSHDCKACKQKNVVHDKFRLVFALPDYAIHPIQIRFLNRIFHRLYFHDRNCIPESTPYCGNDETEITYFDPDSTLNYEALWIEYESRVQKRERRNDLANVLTHNYEDGLTTEERAEYLLSIFPGSGELCSEITNDVYYNNELSNLSTKITLPLPHQHVSPDYERKRQDIDSGYLVKNCLLCQNVNDASHEERLLLATNMSKYQGGCEDFEELMADVPYNRGQKGKDYFKQMAKNCTKYPPYSCKDNCSYYGNECKLNVKNILEVQPVKRNEVRIIEPRIATNSLEETRTNLNDAFQNILAKPESDISGIITDTGGGKTHLLENAALPNDYVISASTYNILNLINRGSLYPQMPKQLAEAFKPFYHIGLQPDRNEIEIYLERLTNGKALLHQYEEYKREQKEALKARQVRITHHRAILDKSVQTNCLQLHDEDPIDILLKTGSLATPALRELCDCMHDEMFSNCRSIFEEILQSSENTVHLTPKRNGEYNLSDLAILLNEKYLKGNGQQIGNVLGLLNSKAYCKVTREKSSEITFMAKNSLSEGKHVTLSATLDILAWRLLYPNIQIFDTGRTAPKANMIQIMDDSFCKTLLIHNSKKLEYLMKLNAKARAQGYATVTHLDIRNKSYDDFDAHFFGLEGMRKLDGRDLAIFGTPNHPDVLLALKAVVLGIMEAPFPVSFYFGGNGRHQATSRMVEYNGMEFRYQMLYQDKTLQQLQLDFTWRQLMQAIGRSRPLSNECTIALFSKFPMMNDGFLKSTNPFG